MDEARQPGDDRRSDALSACGDGVPVDADPETEPLPTSLRQRLDHCAEDWLRDCAARRARARTSARLGPWLVAALALAVALAGWWPQLAQFEAGASSAGGLAQWRAQRERTRMLASPGVEHWAWGSDAEHGAGDVVWDPVRQRGYLRLQGYVPNDPSSAQYQVWVFDAARDDRYPVDGGVFDVPAGRDEVFVPVRARLPVERPVAFAVTVERPGGTVVPDRARLVAFAHAGG